MINLLKDSLLLSSAFGESWGVVVYVLETFRSSLFEDIFYIAGSTLANCFSNLNEPFYSSFTLFDVLTTFLLLMLRLSYYMF